MIISLIFLFLAFVAFSFQDVNISYTDVGNIIFLGMNWGKLLVFPFQTETNSFSKGLHFSSEIPEWPIVKPTGGRDPVFLSPFPLCFLSMLVWNGFVGLCKILSTYYFVLLWDGISASVGCCIFSLSLGTFRKSETGLYKQVPVFENKIRSIW